VGGTSIEMILSNGVGAGRQTGRQKRILEGQEECSRRGVDRWRLVGGSGGGAGPLGELARIGNSRTARIFSKESNEASEAKSGGGWRSA
jgi:hypothetical protein